MIIVAGVDETEAAEGVVRRAIAEAEQWQAELHVVHVTHIPVVLIAAIDQAPTAVDQVSEAVRSVVWRRLSPILDEARIPTKKTDLHGYPPDTLVAYAEEVNADLLVVGTRGRGELAALILGSTSHRVAQLAPCDVLIVRGEST